MTSAKPWTRSRVVAVGLAAGMILMLAGDRGAWTAPPPGIDPLEILNLQIRANAIVILDSSGSMQETLDSGDIGGDDPASKLYIAKAVLSQVLRENERKVSFQFGQYEQPGVGAQTGEMAVPTDEGAAYDPPGDAQGGAMLSSERFLYLTTNVRTPDLATNELTVDLRSYVVPNNARLHLIENGNNVNATVAAGRYATGIALANALATAASDAGTGDNTYTVTYMDNHRFRFTRNSGTLPFSLRWTAMGAGANLALRTEIGGSTTVDQAAGGTPLSATTPNASQGDIDLRRRGNNDFLEGTTRYYKVYARRFFNGQTLVLRQSSTATSTTPPAAPASLNDGDIVCAVDPVLGTTGVGGTGQLADVNDPLSARDQPWVDLVRGDANCNVAAGAQPNRFFFASVPRGNYADRPTAGAREYIPGGGEWRRLNTTPNPDEWVQWASSNTCGGFESLVDLQPCTNNAQFNLVSPFLKPEIEIDPVTRQPLGYSEDADGFITPPGEPPVAGIRAGGSTPIAEAIVDVDDEFTNTLWPVIRPYGGGRGPYPKTFLIFLTDGDDTCETLDGGGSISGANATERDNNRALRAAHRAQRLYESVDTSTVPRTVASSVTTFVVAFGNGVSADRSNWIAWGGSGMVRSTFDEGGSIGLRWDTAPTLADRAACRTCRDAFIASNANELTNALRIAIDQGQSVGVFSDQQSVTESIFELAFEAPQPPDPDDSIDPLKPATRYNSTMPVLLQSTFEMPDFQGHLKAFVRRDASTEEVWDAGLKLNQRISAGMQSLNWSYSDLRGGTGTTDDTIAASTAKIKRRIYSTSRNGVYGVTVGDLHASPPRHPGRVTIWPAETAVDPASGTAPYAEGILDNALGVGPLSSTVLSFQQLADTFGACTSTDALLLPDDCVTQSIGLARQESRQIILAATAGAELVMIGQAAQRGPSRELLFRQRAWSLGESTLAAPAVAGPPSGAAPGRHTLEYDLYTKGPRNALTSPPAAFNAIEKGFGLRSPDDDGTTPPEDMDTRMDLKPVMSVAYHAANDMLHAFRAGPCRDTSGTSRCTGSPAVDEEGGEELWGFVPYDVLGALKDRRSAQKRDPHTYMLAAPVRLSDVFVPGAFNLTSIQASGEGVWRTVIFFGRGIGGKYITALDVTSPGPFTRPSLLTQGPIPLWSRGNPDTQDGLPSGTPNNQVASNTDYDQYLDMGQTWSVPAIGSVRAGGLNVTPRKRDPATDPIEFVAYVGSGYGNTTGCPDGSVVGTRPCEGRRFYALDALTGDIIASLDAGVRLNSTNPFPNALVAGPAGFNAARLSNVDEDINIAADFTERVYFNDIHGRVHRIMTNAPGSSIVLADVNGTSLVMDHPLGVAPALINSSNGSGGPLGPQIYVQSGHDNRIYSPEATPATTPPFKIFGLRDDVTSGIDPDPADDVAGPVTRLFSRPLHDLYRGSTQPATAFAGNGNARVFFAGTRFNPPGTRFAPPPPPCRSSFDSVLFALGAFSGNAAFDLSTGNDAFVEYTGEKFQAIQVVRGRLILDRALGAEIAPEPPPPTTISGTPDDESVFLGSSVPPQWSVTNRSAFMSGTTVCR